jgi:DNA-binding NarL/FixJ family response regulator
LDTTGRRNARPSGDPLRVAIAEDSVLLREGLARLLAEAGFDVVGQSPDADDLLLKIRSYSPDVAIVDIRLPPTHTDEGLRAALEIRERQPAVGVLVLSQYVELGLALKLLANSAEGVGYLLKDRIKDKLVITLRAVEKYVSTSSSSRTPHAAQRDVDRALQLLGATVDDVGEHAALGRLVHVGGVLGRQQRDHRAGRLADDLRDQLQRVLGVQTQPDQRHIGPLPGGHRPHLLDVDLARDHLVPQPGHDLGQQLQPLPPLVRDQDTAA